MFDKIKQDKKTYLIAFLIQFINMIAYLIEFACTYPFDRGWDECECYMAYSEMIGGIFLLEIIPLAFIITFFLPEKICKNKRRVYKTLVLMIVFGWILVFLSFYLSGVIFNIMVK